MRLIKDYTQIESVKKSSLPKLQTLDSYRNKNLYKSLSKGLNQQDFEKIKLRSQSSSEFAEGF